MRLFRSLISIEMLGLIAAFGLAIVAYYACLLYQAATSSPNYGEGETFEGKTWVESDGKVVRDWIITEDPATGKISIRTPTD